MNYKKILVAVDASENARRAVEYVGEIVGSAPDFHVTLLYVIRYAEKDLFPDDETWKAKKGQEKKEALKVLDNLFHLLIQKGLSEKTLGTKLIEIEDFSIAQAIMDYQQKEGFGTIVVGRRGMSKAEEFLFGSISNKIVHYAKDCAVWVIE